MKESEDLKICRAATPGPWTSDNPKYYWGKDHICAEDSDGPYVLAEMNRHMPKWLESAQFITHFNPAYVEKLILERDRYREALEWYADFNNSTHNVEAEDRSIAFIPMVRDCGERARTALKDPTT